MVSPADEPLQEAYEADRLEQQLPVSPDEVDEDVETEGTAPVLPGGSEADRLEQQLPERSVAGRGVPQSGRAVEEGSEADRLEQAIGIPGIDEDDYPRDTED
ncbi:hypothetical protein [Arthrobacter mobilis]|uniref:Uncharacterized protein n=1 Tax=Arthrobacter mobilis TaxID=2724944 RepID=A0A7X6K638_9MICC|nr:hypothetical protein [Arthrobacter mobilis]NKX54338.1 hypothetical protein [Arthrobacter mobilis]